MLYKISTSFPSQTTNLDFSAHHLVQGLPWWFRWWWICLQCTRLGFDPWVVKIPWRREWSPTPVFLPGEFHGQRSLAGNSPWGHKECHTTKGLTPKSKRIQVQLDIYWLLSYYLPCGEICQESHESVNILLSLLAFIWETRVGYRQRSTNTSSVIDPHRLVCTIIFMAKWETPLQCRQNNSTFISIIWRHGLHSPLVNLVIFSFCFALFYLFTCLFYLTISDAWLSSEKKKKDFI